jgi:hypothetical protein
MFRKTADGWVWEGTFENLQGHILEAGGWPYPTDQPFSIKIILPQGAQIDLEEGKSITLKNPKSDFEVAY